MSGIFAVISFCSFVVTVGSSMQSILLNTVVLGLQVNWTKQCDLSGPRQLSEL